jgi:S1-C subfamily serine protease
MTETSMNKLIVAMMAAAALGGAAIPAAAQSVDPEALYKRLADAQRRLEDAAREVAELSGEAATAGGHHEFDIFLPGPRRAMLGVNLGGSEPNGGGVRVEGVSPGGPAAEAGVKAGDIIVAIQAKPVTTGRELVKAMETIEPGEKVAVELRRDGKPIKASVEARPMDHGFMGGPTLMMGAMPAIRALPPMHGMEIIKDTHWLLDEWGDAELVTLTPGLGRYFGADKGVLVAHAPEGSGFGLQDGDVIVAIGGREPQSGRHAMRILRSYQPGESVELKILRDKRAQMLNAKVPARSGHDVPRHRVAPPAPPTPPEAPAET